MAILRGFFEHVPQKERNFFHICDLNTFARRILYKSCRVWFRSFFFWHIVVFCQCGLQSLEVLENLVTLEGWVILPVKSHWTMNISSNFCRTAKSFGWLSNNFLRSSVNFPSLIAAEQYAYCSGGKSNVLSHLCEERPEKPQIFIGILPAVALNRSKRRQKIWESYINNMPKAFPWNTYFMSNLYSEKCHDFTGISIETSLEVLLILTFLAIE